MNLEKAIQFLETYKGRDKILRTLCYASKCASGLSNSPKASSQLDNFSSQLSACRATLRLLDDIPMIAYVLSYGLGKEEKDDCLRILNVISNLVDLVFYPLDHISWAVDHQVIVTNDTRWGTASTACWVISLYLSIFKSTREFGILSEYRSQIQGNDNEAKSAIKNLSKRQLNLILNMLKYSADLIYAVHYLPQGFLWSGTLKKWHVGALGTFSSLLGLYQSLS